MYHSVNNPHRENPHNTSTSSLVKHLKGWLPWSSYITRSPLGCPLPEDQTEGTLGLLRRTLSPCHQGVKAKAYQTLVRPQLEYAAQVWNPYTLDGVNLLEQVQRAAARFVFSDYRRTTSVTPLITTLGWDPLHNRWLLFQMTMFYKIHHGLVSIQFPSIIKPAHNFGRHDHSLKYTIPEASIDLYKFSFYPCTMKIWNQLPSAAVLATSPIAFQEAALPAIKVMRLPVGSRLL